MIVYDIYIKNICKCKTKHKVATFDYLCNAINRKNELIKTFGTDGVIIQRREIK